MGREEIQLAQMLGETRRRSSRQGLPEASPLIHVRQIAAELGIEVVSIVFERRGPIYFIRNTEAEPQQDTFVVGESAFRNLV